MYTPLCAFAEPKDAMEVNDAAINQAEAELQKSQTSLAGAKARLREMNAQCSSLDAEVREIQAKILKTAEKAKKAQAAMLDGRAALSNAVLYEYKNDTISTYLEMLLGSTSFSELTETLAYITQVIDHHSDEVKEQKALREKLDQIGAELESDMNEQEKKLSKMREMENEAESLVSSLSAELGAKSKKLASLKKQAEELKKANEAVIQPQPQAEQVSKGAAPSSDKPKAPSKDENPTPEPQETAQPSQDDSATISWKTGSASAYGGSSDPYTPNPARTATGATCDDNSMGVAIPMAWPNYRSLLGHTVVIEYNGRTVYATINDCGGMGGGARALDLQPGVFKALGFKTCQAWGVRTVRYRIL